MSSKSVETTCCGNKTSIGLFGRVLVIPLTMRWKGRVESLGNDGTCFCMKQRVRTCGESIATVTFATWLCEVCFQRRAHQSKICYLSHNALMKGKSVTETVGEDVTSHRLHYSNSRNLATNFAPTLKQCVQSIIFQITSSTKFKERNVQYCSLRYWKRCVIEEMKNVVHCLK